MGKGGGNKFKPFKRIVDQWSEVEFLKIKNIIYIRNLACTPSFGKVPVSRNTHSTLLTQF